jgi:hypothetical protein
MTYIKRNLAKPAGISPGSSAPKSQIAIIDIEDLAPNGFPVSDSSGVKLMGSFVMKEGAKPYLIYSTRSKTEAPYESDGDEDSININQSFKVHHPGNTLEVKEFIQNWLGRNVVVAHRACQDNFWEVMGTPCAPLQIMPTKQDNNDGRHYEIMFQAFASTALVPKHFEGELPFADPFAVADVTDITLSTANGYQYKLPALAATEAVAFNATTLAHGTMVSLLGGGGAEPATLANGIAGDITVLLVNGSTWTGLVNQAIHLRVFRAGATTYLIEQSRG